MYQGDNFSYIWGKIYNGITSGNQLSFINLAFSSDGTLIAVATNFEGFIIVLRAIDGGIIDSRKFTPFPTFVDDS